MSALSFRLLSLAAAGRRNSATLWGPRNPGTRIAHLHSNLLLPPSFIRRVCGDPELDVIFSRACASGESRDIPMRFWDRPALSTLERIIPDEGIEMSLV